MKFAVARAVFTDTSFMYIDGNHTFTILVETEVCQGPSSPQNNHLALDKNFQLEKQSGGVSWET